MGVCVVILNVGSAPSAPSVLTYGITAGAAKNCWCFIGGTAPVPSILPGGFAAVEVCAEITADLQGHKWLADGVVGVQLEVEIEQVGGSELNLDNNHRKLDIVCYV